MGAATIVFHSELAESLYAPYRLSEDKSITQTGAFLLAYRTGSDEAMAGFTNGGVRV